MRNSGKRKTQWVWQDKNNTRPLSGKKNDKRLKAELMIENSEPFSEDLGNFLMLTGAID